ncbi:MAG: hypothetical protein AAFV54_14305 [Pseudomonadota bacterium]
MPKSESDAAGLAITKGTPVARNLSKSAIQAAKKFKGLTVAAQSKATVTSNTSRLKAAVRNYYIGEKAGK